MKPRAFRSFIDALIFILGSLAILSVITYFNYDHNSYFKRFGDSLIASTFVIARTDLLVFASTFLIAAFILYILGLMRQ